ncbi:MAG: hypothetical protein Ct9H300mP20_11360 [Gammaproteobacteria bacterium]|nr:MAG: hypothetical protein Ct9H300mP20_11360 [Gammaproteobacteria bacterium]
MVTFQEDIDWYGSAIEARLYAEDPRNDFLPATGTLIAYEPNSEVEARWDSGVEEGSVIGTEFDPMIAKVICYGENRLEAANKLSMALEAFSYWRSCYEPRFFSFYFTFRSLLKWLNYNELYRKS